MTRRPAIAATLIVAIVVAYGHCLAHGAQSVAFVASAVHERGQAAPLSPHDPACENESGCICRGVVFVAPVDFDQVQRDAQQLGDLIALLDERTLAGELGTSVEFPRNWTVFDAPAPRSGRMLRAYISSLLN